MTISVIEPLTPAIERTKLILFQPFDMSKWLALGFCAFLMGLGSGGGGGGSGGQGGGGGPDFEPVIAWIRENFALIASIVAAVIVVGLLIGLLVTWLSSRGHFMFLDGVVHNRGAVSDPWREYRAEANSLFRFRFCLGLIGLVYLVLVLVICGLIAWPTIQEGPGPMLFVAILVAIVLFLPFGIVISFVTMLLDDFIVPIMYLRRGTSMEAWREFRSSLWPGNAVKFLLYFGFKILLGMGIGFVTIIVVVMTCCMAALPYVSSVVFLPVTVFLRCYALYFLQQFGPEWAVLGPQKPLPLEGVENLDMG